MVKHEPYVRRAFMQQQLIKKNRAAIIEAELALVKYDESIRHTPTEALRTILNVSKRHYASCAKGAGDCLTCSLVIYAKLGLQSMGESGS